MKTRILLALGLIATGTLATLRVLPRRRNKRAQSQYDAEINTWEGEGGSLDAPQPGESSGPQTATGMPAPGHQQPGA